MPWQSPRFGVVGREVTTKFRIEDPAGGTAPVTLSVGGFVPKPFTPFQWFGQNTDEELHRKIKIMMQDRPDLIQSKLEGLAFDRLHQVFRKSDIEIAMALKQS